MKKVGYIVLMISLCFYKLSANVYDYYQQRSDLVVYATDEQSYNRIVTILNHFNLKYEATDQLYNDANKLFIITGDLSQMGASSMPDHYIAYQTKEAYVTGDYLTVLSKAIVVWDISWSNISRYREQVGHWYYLPNEQYEYLDPVVLSCFLPRNALYTYRSLLQHSNNRNTDFSSHIPTLFCHCLLQDPVVAIESGIRWGDGSTVAFRHVMPLLPNAHLIGLDIDNCARHYAGIPNAMFFQMDDVAFPNHFKTMQLNNKEIDFVFIDTSHQYQHTLDEIDAFSSVMSDNGMFVFHDSNVAITHPVRINGTSCGSGIGNPKGVTDGLKSYFNVTFDEGQYLNILVEKNGYLWNLINYPFCYGLAVAKRIKKGE